jgi:hypothetical protein
LTLRKEPLLPKPFSKWAKFLLMQSKVPNLQTRPEVTFSPRADEGPDRNLTPLATVLCPTVGTNYRGNLETVAMGWLIEGARQW